MELRARGDAGRWSKQGRRIEEADVRDGRTRT